MKQELSACSAAGSVSNHTMAKGKHNWWKKQDRHSPWLLQMESMLPEGNRSLRFHMGIYSENTCFDRKENNWQKGAQSHSSKVRTMWESRTITNGINTCNHKRITKQAKIITPLYRHFILHNNNEILFYPQEWQKK